MSTLKNKYISDTFKSLLKLYENTIYTGNTLYNVSDGYGNILPISFTPNTINVDNISITGKVFDNLGLSGKTKQVLSRGVNGLEWSSPNIILSGNLITLDIFVDYTASTQTQIDSKLDTVIFATYTANTPASLGLFSSGVTTGATFRIDSNNNATGLYSTVSGGFSNTAQGNSSTIPGGINNTVISNESVISGGKLNYIDGYPAPWINGASCGNSVIAGGLCNTISGYYVGYNSIGGGYKNTISGPYTPFSTISGGYCNTASCYGSFIGGGGNNKVFGGIIVGGCFNTSSNYSFIGNGTNNISSGNNSFIGSGVLNKISPACSFIGGGNSNTISGNYSNNSFIGGGFTNTITNGCYSSIIGGYTNNIYNSFSSIIGGINNTINSSYGFIGGGQNNTNSGYYSSIINGRGNILTSINSTIVGGQSNTVSSIYSFVAGGQNNLTISNNTFILGSNITADTINTTFVENINIRGLIYDSIKNTGFTNSILTTTSTGIRWVSASTIDISTKLNVSDFNAYSAYTLNLINSNYNQFTGFTQSFNGYSANTLNLINSNYNQFTGFTQSFNVYSANTLNLININYNQFTGFTQSFNVYSANTLNLINSNFNQFTGFTQSFNGYSANTLNLINSNFNQFTGFTQSFNGYSANTLNLINNKYDKTGGVINGDVSIMGNLTINGSATTVNTVNLVVYDPIIGLALSQSGTTNPTLDSGIITDRGLSGNTAFVWIESNKQYELGYTNNTYNSTNITINRYGDLKLNTLKPFYIFDINNNTGTTNQVLTTTPSGIAWSTMDLSSKLNVSDFNAYSAYTLNLINNNFSLFTGFTQSFNSYSANTFNLINNNFSLFTGFTQSFNGYSANTFNLINNNFSQFTGFTQSFNSYSANTLNLINNNFSQFTGFTQSFNSYSANTLNLINNKVIESDSGALSAVRINANNRALGNFSSVLGGTGNTATGQFGFIGGGTNNLVNTNNTFILGSNLTGTTSNTTFVESLNILSRFNTPALFIRTTGSTASLVTLSNGNTGVGTPNPLYRFDVSGTTNVMRVIGSASGSTLPIFTIQGSQGELFSVTDNLTGSLFSVNNISGLPILEVFSNDEIIMGDYLVPALFTTKRTTVTTGTTSIYRFSTLYEGAFVDYTLRNANNARSGQMMAIWSGNTINYSETTTVDIGNTSSINMYFIMSGGTPILTASASTIGWTVKSLIKSI